MSVTHEEILYFNTTLKKISNYDFSEYSEKSLGRRLQKILTDRKINIHQLIRKIKQDPEFLEKVIQEITVNTTELFRDPPIWHTIMYRVLPKFANKPRINIWHTGASSGLEVYSMLIIMHRLGLLEKANVYATDINTHIMEIGKKGIYPYRFNIEYLENFDKVINENPYNYDERSNVPYSEYFKIDKLNDTIEVKKFIREKVKWFKHDLVKQKNIFNIKFDIIFCRNVLIYFNQSLQTRIINMLYDSLVPRGFLILGIHETILGEQANNFIKKGMVYTKKTI